MAELKNIEEAARQRNYIEKLKKYLEEKTQGQPRTYYIETLGCQMNAKDSEKLAGI